MPGRDWHPGCPWASTFGKASSLTVTCHCNNCNLQFVYPRSTYEFLRTRWIVSVRSRSNWNLEVLVFEERGKPDYSEKNLSEQGREPTTNSTHRWRWRQDLNPGHVGGRRVLSQLQHSHEPPEVPVTLINSGKMKQGRGGGKCTIQRLNEVNEPQKINVVLL